MRGRRIKRIVPSHLPVVVAVNVHKARRDQQAIGIDDAVRALTDLPAQCADDTVTNGEIAAARRRTCAIDQHSALDD